MFPIGVVAQVEVQTAVVRDRCPRFPLLDVVGPGRPERHDRANAERRDFFRPLAADLVQCVAERWDQEQRRGVYLCCAGAGESCDGGSAPQGKSLDEQYGYSADNQRVGERRREQIELYEQGPRVKQWQRKQ